MDNGWFYYLGGGTFDVALIKIKDGEMKVIDHEGDNFLGGTDFDNMIVDNFLIPKIKEQYSFGDLEKEMKSASGKHNSKYYVLLRRAEEAKILLSAKSSAEILIDGFEDEEGNEVDMEVIVTRSEFNEIVRPSIDRTIEMIKTILTRNSLKALDLQFTLMVGGSTYIPYVRQRAEEILQIPVNCEIDPTTAVAVGAAYYAATKQKEFSKEDKPKKQTPISIRASYIKASKEKEELFAARISGNIEGLFYKVVRQDGGYDSGLKKLTERINEDLPLVENAYNFFSLTVYDAHNNVIETDIEPIGINGGFPITQPLPEDICLEVDDYSNPGHSKLFLIFPKNSGLPNKKIVTFPINKILLKGDENDRIWINVYEGPSTSLPEANKPVGVIEIKGKMVSRDIAKGSEIEITISISESRDLTVSAYLNMADQEFKNVFNPKVRDTNVNLLKEQVSELNRKLDEEIEIASKKEKFEIANELKKLKDEIETITEKAGRMASDDVTDDKFKIEDKKRKIAQGLDAATKDKRIEAAKENYNKTKRECKTLIDETGNDYERKIFNDIISQEDAFFFY